MHAQPDFHDDDHEGWTFLALDVDGCEPGLAGIVGAVPQVRRLRADTLTEPATAIEVAAVREDLFCNRFP